MGIVRKHPPVKLFAGVLFNTHFKKAEFENTIAQKIDIIEKTSELFDFSHTNYYEQEMGRGLKKYFIVFASLVDPLKLPDYKLICNELEESYADEDGNRSINVDPGYVSEAKVILATTKNFDHRVYVGKGIFADVQLRLRNKVLCESDWTYPDYRIPRIKQFLLDIRKDYYRQLSQLKNISTF